MRQKQQGRHRSGAKKYGHNKEKCARYAAQGRREANKARRAAKLARKLNKRRSAERNLT